MPAGESGVYRPCGNGRGQGSLGATGLDSSASGPYCLADPSRCGWILKDRRLIPRLPTRHQATPCPADPIGSLNHPQLPHLANPRDGPTQNPAGWGSNLRPSRAGSTRGPGKSRIGARSHSGPALLWERYPTATGYEETVIHGALCRCAGRRDLAGAFLVHPVQSGTRQIRTTTPERT